MVGRTTARRGWIGASRAGCVTAIAAAGLLFWVLIPVVRLEMRYRSAQERVQDEVGEMSVDRTYEARDQVAPLIRELGLPRAAERVNLSLLPGTVRRYRVTLRYADTIRIARWSWVISRRIDAETQ